ncbi:MAG TPA: hypothetical protein VI894_03755 [Candidatus Nanoarchaeia archaeon]|nr:hypothetical protein [Candidatus Nanoarchaeia archaeon]
MASMMNFDFICPKCGYLDSNLHKDDADLRECPLCKPCEDCGNEIRDCSCTDWS